MAVVRYVQDKVLNRDHWSFVRTNAWKSLLRKMKTLHWKLTSFWIGSQFCIVFWLVWKRLPYSIIRDHFKAHLNHPKESKLQPFNNQKLSSQKHLQTPKQKISWIWSHTNWTPKIHLNWIAWSHSRTSQEHLCKARRYQCW